MIGNRLREERERLGLTQPVFAELAGAKKRTLIDWEKDVSSPTAVQLAQLAAAGADVLYILTGGREGPPPAPALSAEEETMLAYFRDASKEVRRAALGALLSSTAGGQVFHGNVSGGVAGNNVINKTTKGTGR